MALSASTPTKPLAREKLSAPANLLAPRKLSMPLGGHSADYTLTVTLSLPTSSAPMPRPPKSQHVVPMMLMPVPQKFRFPRDLVVSETPESPLLHTELPPIYVSPLEMHVLAHSPSPP
ncbi:hypothetical protein KIL84_020132 [Mauremys mutica]|uniref:Uncharacterized protein n=1 Tax=Mauremys mutica TaxID=74926 RepID=A0A9D3XW86_9SAUR|nr:hypothetical protein KIL84_020132 [Mauremys mutica]